MDGDTCVFHVKTEVISRTVGLDVELRTQIRWMNQRIRFCGINAPELTGPPKVDGQKALDFVNEILKQAKKIQVVVPHTACPQASCVRRDSFGRIVGTVLVDGVSLSQKLIDSNHAVLVRNAGWIPCFQGS